MELRQFLRVDEENKQWEDLGMEWIHHHNPELFILDDRDQVKEKIDLNGFTRSKLIRLLEQKGFKRA